MKFKKLLFPVIAACLLTLPSYGQDEVTNEGIGSVTTTNFNPDFNDYEIINGNISEPLLKRYLKRNVHVWLEKYVPASIPGCGSFGNSQQYGYWMDFLTTIKPKMVHLDDGITPDNMWEHTSCGAFIPRLTQCVNDIHNIDRQIIVGAALSEFLEMRLGADISGGYHISIPQWVKDDLRDFPGMEDYFFTSPNAPNRTHFEASEMLLTNGPGTETLVDVNKLMTIAWYYFWAKQYIDMGIESIGINRPDVIGKNDFQYEKMGRLTEKLRNYAKINGRRNFCLFTGGFQYVGNPAAKNLLFDYGASPLYIYNTGNSGNGSNNASGILSYGDGLQFPNKNDYEALLGECGNDPGSPYGHSPDGNHPMGWHTDHMPYKVGFDLVAGLIWFAQGITTQTYASYCKFPWSYDESSWFAQQSKLYRDQFLLYAWHKVRCLDHDAAYLEMPGELGYRFVLNGTQYHYKSYDAPGGQYHAGTIKNIWDANDETPPPGLEHYGRWATDFLQIVDFHPSDYPDGRLYYGDFDGDGQVDILETADKSKGQYWVGWKLFLANGFTSFSSPSQTSTAPYSGWGERFYVGDFNGDGMDDFITTADETQTPGSSWYGYRLYTSTGNGFNFTSSDTWPGWGERFFIGDYDGDGKDDFLVTGDEPILHNNVWYGNKVYTSTGTGFNYSFYQYLPSWGERFYIGDFNGDHKSDLLVTADKDILTNSAWGGNRIYHSNGSGFDQKTWTAWPGWGENFIVCDWNKDGHDDITVVASNKNSVNWQGSKTYLCNEMGNQFIYAFDYAAIGVQSNTNASIYADTKYFGVRSDVNILMASTTYPGAEGQMEWAPLHCSEDIWTSQKPGNGNNNNVPDKRIVTKAGNLSSNNNSLRDVNSTLSLDQINDQIKSGIYPNPSKGVFHVNSPYIQGSQIEILDCYGKKIMEMYADQPDVDIDLSGFSNGVYLMTLKSKQYSFKYQLVVSK
jgi:hypothetical protein